MKKLTIAIIFGVALVGLSGCGGKDTNATKSDTSDSKDKVEQVSKSSSIAKESKDIVKNAPDNEKDTVASSSEDKPKEQTKDTQPEVSKEKVSDDPQSPFEDHTVRTESGSKTDLSKARIVLYQAGVDSYPVSDDKILELWKSATSEEEFLKLIQDYLSDLK